MRVLNVCRENGGAKQRNLTPITKPKQPQLMHHATPTLYLNAANLRLVYKLEMKNNVRIQLRFMSSIFSGTTKARLFIFETKSGIL